MRPCVPASAVLGITCDQCQRREQFDLEALKAQHGGDVKMPELLSRLVADCPRNQQKSFSVSDLCRAVYDRASLLFRWLRRWRQRDDQHLVKRDAPENADPIDQLRRLVNEAQERDATDERRLYPWRDRPTSTRRPKKSPGATSTRPRPKGR
jgi:transposase-like protein